MHMHMRGLHERLDIARVHVCAVCEQQSDDVRATMVACAFKAKKKAASHAMT